jgi:hypothetical protein
MIVFDANAFCYATVSPSDNEFVPAQLEIARIIWAASYPQRAAQP